MNRRILPILCLLQCSLLSLPAASPVTQQVVDRIAAVVNEQIITLSDLYWTIGYKRLTLPEDPERREEMLRVTLQQIVEQRLIADEATATPGLSVTSAEIDARIEAYQRQFESLVDFEFHLQEIGMTAGALRDLVRRQLTVLKFVSIRFEPFVVVLPDQIQAFYQEEFLPGLGVPAELAPSLELVQEQIRQILQVEITNRDIESWMENARRRAQIRSLLF